MDKAERIAKLDKVMKQMEEGSYESPVGVDMRFTQQNQTRHCYQYYVDYHRCQKAQGKGHPSCEKFKTVYEAMCPNSWIEKFDTQIAENRFPGKI